ncbi:MAG: adenylate/guanylate cyclase domain-containing protein [Candidatus Edwardsbacteria bacterium]|jgi:class 3 adenylate cyclase|nr:adenylate/guanylate cyclase domain-containing protein [Candidatus Edwardsbacteria bacterium]
MRYRRSIVLGASRQRLDKLVRERLQPGADTKAIDRRIWRLFGGRWCVMFTDLAGFSRNVAEYGIVHFLQNIYRSECLLAPVVERYDGLILKFEGDSFLAVFRSPRRAVAAALEMQRELAGFNRDLAPENQVLLGVGLGYGPMLRIGDSDVFGAEVNAASKLGEDVAGPGDVLVTANVRAAVGKVRGSVFRKLAAAPPGATAAYSLLRARSGGRQRQRR